MSTEHETHAQKLSWLAGYLRQATNGYRTVPVMLPRIEALEAGASSLRASQVEQEQKKNGDGAGLICQAIPDIEGSKPRPIKAVRVEWLKLFAAHLRERASDNGCMSFDGICITEEPDLDKWCDYCRLGESAVQIELLVSALRGQQE